VWTFPDATVRGRHPSVVDRVTAVSQVAEGDRGATALSLPGMSTGDFVPGARSAARHARTGAITIPRLAIGDRRRRPTC